MVSRRRVRRLRLAAIGVPVALMATGTGTVPSAAPAAGEAARSTEQCRVVQLAEPRWGHDGGVMDIERIGGRVVYYGNIQQRVDGEGHQRALIWRGRHARPERVGPRGFDADTAYELTDTGLINGRSESWDTGETQHWVQDLATMEVTFLDIDSGPRGTDHGDAIIRRINGTGAAAGTVPRSSDPEVLGSDAVGFDHPLADMTILDGSAGAYEGAALGINDAGERAGLLGTDFLPDDPDFLIFDAMKWNADGSRTELVSPYGLDAIARNIKDDGTASGLMGWGHDPDTTHIEAAYWPSPGRAVGLGVLPGGTYSDALGMDEGGWLVGVMDRLVDAEQNRFGPEGSISHSFLWRSRLGEGSVRILPSLYGLRYDLPWEKWVGSAVHAVNADLNQAGSASHVRFAGRRLVSAPTVYLNADRCGVVRSTTHDPFDLMTRGTSPNGRTPDPVYREELRERVRTSPQLP